MHIVMRQSRLNGRKEKGYLYVSIYWIKTKNCLVFTFLTTNAKELQAFVNEIKRKKALHYNNSLNSVMFMASANC